MAAFFSFRKLITPYFVKTIYTIGFAALTAAGTGWAVWAGMRFNTATLSRRQAIYYIAIGVGVLLVGNLAWRMLCEFWLLLFKMHGLLASIERGVNHESIEHQSQKEAIKKEQRSDSVRERATASVSPSRSVLGLSS